MEVSIKDDELIKYVKDIDYCKVDSDCYLAYRGCSYGSYNFYQELSFFPFGCGPITDSEFSNEYLIGNLDENLGCVADVKYLENKCVDNVCRAFGRDLSCQK